MTAILQPSEDQLQIFTCDLLSAFGKKDCLWWHTPNGGYRHPSVARKMQRFGVRKGVPDWTFNFSHGYRVAYLELKGHKGQLSPEQKEFREKVESYGIPYRVARTCDEIVIALTEFGVIENRGVQKNGSQLKRPKARQINITAPRPHLRTAKDGENNSR